MTVDRKVLTMYRQNLAIHSSRKCCPAGAGPCSEPAGRIVFSEEKVFQPARQAEILFFTFDDRSRQSRMRLPASVMMHRARIRYGAPFRKLTPPE